MKRFYIITACIILLSISSGCSLTKYHIDTALTLENAAKADHVFSMLMGEDVAPRREFIEKNATYAKIDA